MVGLSHKTAPLAVRERLACDDAGVRRVLLAMRSTPKVEECLVLSTCNRTEVYAVPASTVEVDQVAAVLAGVRGVSPNEVVPVLAGQHGANAARHALRVAAGLESLAVGEPQVLGQVRRALETAREVQTAGPVLHRLIQTAIATGRKIRHATGLTGRASSVPHAALRLCGTLRGPLRDRRVTVVGAGEIAALAVKVFAAAGAHIVAVANRTVETAALLAARVGAEAIALEAMGRAAASSDIVIVSLGAEAPVLDVEAFADTLPRPTPLLILDLSVPRRVAPGVGVPGVELHDLDSLEAHADAGPSDDDLRHAEQLIDEALRRFLRWQASRTATPVIAALRARAEQIVDDELSRVPAGLRGLDPAQQDAVRAVVHTIVRRLLHVPIVRLRESAAGDRPQVLSAAAELFDLSAEIPKTDGEAE